MSIADTILPIGDVIARLETELTGFNEIGGAAGYGRARGELRRTPAAYALPLRDTPGPNRFAGDCGVGHRVVAGFAVVIVARDVRHDGGVGAVSELETCRARVHAALLGWEPGAEFEACWYTGGLLISDIGRDGMMAWQASYATASQLQEGA